MTKSEFRTLLSKTFADLEALTALKGEEYSGSDDQLANFKRNAEQTGASVLLVWYIYFNKHIDSIRNFIRSGDVLSEPITSRIDDAMLYLLLLKAIVKEAGYE